MTSACRCPLALGLVGLMALAACGSDGDAGPDSAGGTGPGAGGSAGNGGIPASELPYEPCPVETGVGQFAIDLDPEFTSVEGRVDDGVSPAFVPSTIMSEGSCRLVELPALACDPACPASIQTCGPGNQCLPLPVAHDVGSVSVSGLARPIEMTPTAATKTYRPPPPALPHPGFEPGADIRLSASGGDYAPFELRGWGITVFQPPTDPIIVAEGEPVHLVWTAPADPGPARISASLNINHHGSTTISIDCDFPDTGAADIPASLVDALFDRGTSGNPTITLGRRTATSTVIAPGCVQLLVRSEDNLDVSVPGVISCDNGTPCPDGMTCDALGQYCF